MELFTKIGQHLRLFFLIGCVQAFSATLKLTQTCQESLWVSLGIARLNVIHNEKSTHFQPFDIQNFKLQSQMCSLPIRLQNSLIINVSRREQSMSYIFQKEIDTKERQQLGVAHAHSKQLFTEHLYDACAKTSDIVVVKIMTNAWC